MTSKDAIQELPRGPDGVEAPIDASLLGQLKALLRLATPIMVAQGGLVAMGLTDTFVIGQVSAVEMGGVALGNIVTLIAMMFGLGLTMGIEPLVAQAHGAGEAERAYGWYQQGLWLAALSSIPVTIGIAACVSGLPYSGVSERVIAATVPYVWLRLPSVVVTAMYGAARSYLTSVQRTRPVVVAVVVANVVNLIMDYVLVLGFNFGAAGVAVATTVCWTLMFIIAATAVHGVRPSGQPAWVAAHGAQQWRIIRIGTPIGLQMTAEVGIFALVGFLVARMGEVPLSAHQIAITLASFTFMSAVGIGVGATALVGHHIGAGRPMLARRIGLLAIAVGGVFMTLGGIGFWVFDETLARLFSPTDEAVVQVGAQLLQIAALFSVSDGIQAVSAGALRGAGETASSFYANAIAHWAVGLPLGLYLSEVAGLGARGLWWGLTAGLTGVAIALTVRFVQVTQGELRRVE